MDSLLIDPEHPRRGQPDFEAIAPHVQRDYAEAIAQLVMFPPGKEACLQNPAVAEALRHVAQEGWTDEARLSAEGALAALVDDRQQPEAGNQPQAHDHGKHASSDLPPE